jgi:hypothetical protein
MVTKPRATATVKHLRPELPRPPKRVARLPLDKRGYPIPWFAARFDSEPDFRVYDPLKFTRAVRERLCWVCGDRLSAVNYFVISPYDAVHRTSTEPPCHQDCAEFSVKACPFLTRAEVRRRTAGLPDESFEAAGVVTERPPGIIVIWATLSYDVVPAPGGVVCALGDTTAVRWFKGGRPATRADVLAVVEAEFPGLGLGRDEVGAVMRLFDRATL